MVLDDKRHSPNRVAMCRGGDLSIFIQRTANRSSDRSRTFHFLFGVQEDSFFGAIDLRTVRCTSPARMHER